jgi:hypothetical protein
VSTEVGVEPPRTKHGMTLAYPVVSGRVRDSSRETNTVKDLLDLGLQREYAVPPHNLNSACGEERR